MRIDVKVLNHLINVYCGYDTELDFPQKDLPNLHCVSYELLETEDNYLKYEAIFHDEDTGECYAMNYYESMSSDYDCGYGLNPYEKRQRGEIELVRVYPKTIQTVIYCETP